MSLRITQGSLFNRTLIDIRSGLSRYTALQTQVSTGRRISRPSDDPAGALRIIPLTNDLRNLDQMTSNVNLAKETLNTGAASLEDASAIMQRARELTMQAANGSISPSDRRSISAEIGQLLNQMVSVGNSRRGDRYLFSGTNSSTAPFSMVDSGGGTRVVYHGNHESLQVEVAPGVNTALNLPGDRIFQNRDRGTATITGNTGAALTGTGDTAVGYQNLEVTFNGLHTDAPSTVTAGAGQTTAVGVLDYAFTTGPNTLSIGGGPALPIPVTDGTFTTSDGRTISLTVTGVPATPTGTFTAKAGLSTDGGETLIDVSDFSDTSVAVANFHDGSTLNVDVTGLQRTGTDLVKHTGTFDTFTVLITLRDLMENEAGLDQSEVQTRIASMLAEIDGAHDAVLDGLRELGFRSSSMDVLQNRVSNLKVTRAESLSLVQDTDIAEAILNLQRQDIVYQAALSVGSRTIQLSLQGLLR